MRNKQTFVFCEIYIDIITEMRYNVPVGQPRPTSGSLTDSEQGALPLAFSFIINKSGAFVNNKSSNIRRNQAKNVF